jgi:hypothetical protein
MCFGIHDSGEANCHPSPMTAATRRNESSASHVVLEAAGAAADPRPHVDLVPSGWGGKSGKYRQGRRLYRHRHFSPCPSYGGTSYPITFSTLTKCGSRSRWGVGNSVSCARRGGACRFDQSDPRRRVRAGVVERDRRAGHLATWQQRSARPLPTFSDIRFAGSGARKQSQWSPICCHPLSEFH